MADANNNPASNVAVLLPLRGVQLLKLAKPPSLTLNLYFFSLYISSCYFTICFVRLIFMHLSNFDFEAQKVVNLVKRHPGNLDVVIKFDVLIS